MVVGGAGPQTDHIRTVLLEDLRGVHAVAQGLVHGTALAVHGPAVGDALLEGCALAEGTAIFGFITALLILFMK